MRPLPMRAPGQVELLRPERAGGVTIRLMTEKREHEPASELPLYLHRRGETYYFKRKIPADVARAFPDCKGQVWKSLKTTQYDDALIALTRENREFERICRRGRGKEGHSRHQIEALKERPPGTTKYLLPEHIPVLIQRFEHYFLRMDDDERR